MDGHIRSHRPAALHPCPWCGPYGPSKAHDEHGQPICPRCGMTAGEIAYAERILADSAAVYAEEHRAFQQQRRAS